MSSSACKWSDVLSWKICFCFTYIKINSTQRSETMLHVKREKKCRSETVKNGILDFAHLLPSDSINEVGWWPAWVTCKRFCLQVVRQFCKVLFLLHLC